MTHEVVGEKEWTEKRTAFLKEEKEFSKTRDALAAKRRSLPWMKVDNDYVFEGSDGKASLSDLFGKKQQLIVYHLMYAPEWKGACKTGSFHGIQRQAIPFHMIFTRRSPKTK